MLPVYMQFFILLPTLAACYINRFELPRTLRAKHSLLSARRRRGVNQRKRLPRLVVFDLDGCLWRPELFEIETCPYDSKGSPFSFNEKDSLKGTTLRSAGGSHTVSLLGDTRSILNELFYEEKWYPSSIGISSRTHPSCWAEELLSLFSIYDDKGSETRETEQSFVTMKDVFTPQLCIMERSMNKYKQFELLLERANQLKGRNQKPMKYEDIIFFDNEAGNCKQVAQLGVTTVYTPKGLTRQAWDNGLANFPSASGSVLGPKLPY